jgi:SAM-dependent methyltransferase
MTAVDNRQQSTACSRNREPILRVLESHLPEKCDILEIGSGTGEHGVFFAEAHAKWTWRPSDVSAEALESIRAWIEQADLSNCATPLRLDVASSAWPVNSVGAVFCANMIHVSPWECTLALLDGAARVLAPGKVLITYGPYKLQGKHTAPSNEAFDETLRSSDPEWGVRDLDLVVREALNRGLRCSEIIKMPANNFCVVYTRMVD